MVLIIRFHFFHEDKDYITPSYHKYKTVKK